jgi:hypothetical protein
LYCLWLWLLQSDALASTALRLPAYRQWPTAKRDAPSEKFAPPVLCYVE